MSKLYLNNFSEVNLYKKMSTRSEVTTQMIYGDSFSIIKKKIIGLKLKLKKMVMSVLLKKEIITITKNHRIKSR